MAYNEKSDLQMWLDDPCCEWLVGALNDLKAGCIKALIRSNKDDERNRGAAEVIEKILAKVSNAKK